MTTAYTSLLGLALPVTGELSGTWGDTVNNSITSLVDTAVAGTTNVSTDSNVTLTTTTGASNQARQAILLFSGARTAIRTVTAPAQSKIYTVINATTGGFAVTLVGAGPTTGLTIPNGASAVVAWNGSDFIEIGASRIGNLTVNGTLTVTGVATFSAGSAAAPAITTTGDTNTGIFFPAADTIAFAEGGVEAMRLDSSGNMGLGATPSAWGSNFKALQIGVSSPKVAITAQGDTDAIQLWSNAYADASAERYIASRTVGKQIINGNTFAWYNAASGTAGNAISWTQAMTLDASGNLGVGTTSPISRLHVLDSLSGGQLIVSNSETNSATKYGTFATQHYTNAEEPAMCIGMECASTANNVLIGGALGEFNAATNIQFYTAANNTTTGGTERARIDSSGNFGIGTSSPASRLNVSTGEVTLVTYTSTRGSGSYNTYAMGTSGTILGYIGHAPQLVLGSSDNQFAIRAETSLLFATGGANERARIDSNGNLLIGATGLINNERLTVVKANTGGVGIAFFGNNNNASGDQVIRTSLGSNAIDTSSYHFVAAQAGGSDRLYIYGNGNVVNVNNSYGALSDIKLKENVTDATPKLEKLNQVRVVNYNRIGENQKQIGVIAQELEQIFPSMIDETPDRDAEGNDLGTTTKSVKYSVFVPMLIKAMQEMKSIIDDQAARIAVLEAK